MATTTIPWSDGSGDNIYLTYPSASGNQTVSVSSDANTGAARSKVVTFSASGVSPVSLTINQAAGTPQEVTIQLNPTSYDENDYSWESSSNISRGYTDATSTTYATISYLKESRGKTYIYYQFDTSSIPANATINSVTCVVKVRMQGNNTVSPTRTVQMFSGTTAKGSAQSLTTQNDTTFTFSGETWTRAEVGNIRVKALVVRGTSQVTTGYSMRFYGATLTIKYTI